MRTKTRVRTVFLGFPKGSKWPGQETNSPMFQGAYSLESRARKYSEKLSEFENEYLEFVGKDLIRTEADLAGIEEMVKSEDGVLAFYLGAGARGMREVLSWGVPTIFCNAPGYVNIRGKHVIPVRSSDFKDVQRKAGVLEAIHRLKEAKILYVSSRGLSEEFRAQAKEKLGVEIKNVENKRLLDACDDIDEEMAKELAQKWIDNAEAVIEPTEKDVLEASRLYYGIKKVMGEEDANVITIACFGLYIGTDLPLPCLAFVQLNDEGMAGVCQADISATLTQIMIGYIGDRPGFVANTFVDTATDTVAYSHCLAATKMEGVDGEAEPYLLRDHMGDYRSVCFQVRMQVGKKVTVASFRPFNRMLISTPQIVGDVHLSRPPFPPYDEHNCRTQVVTKGVDAKKMMRETLSDTGHRVLFYGDWLDEVRDMGRLLDFEIFEEG
jgi:hypothetical protein